jgi:DNA-binding beta-propeller fold protein YncE
MIKTNPFITFIATGLVLAVPSANAAESEVLRLDQTILLEGVDGRIDHLAGDTKRERLYVAALGNNTVEVIDLAAGRRLETIKGVEEPQGIVVIPGSHRVVIASGGDDKCRIYDQSLKLVAQIDDLGDADNVRYNARTGQVIVGYGHGALAFIDPQSGKKVSEIKLDGHPESFQFGEDGNRIFVNVPGAGHVAVLDASRQAVAAKWPLTEAKSNYPMALDEADHRLFIGCRRPAKLLVVDTESGKNVTSLDIVEGTDDVFYDRATRRVYVSGSKGSISIIQQSDADHYAAVVEVPTAPGAQSSYFDADSGKLYVAIPHRGSQMAQIAIFTTRANSKIP